MFISGTQHEIGISRRGRSPLRGNRPGWSRALAAPVFASLLLSLAIGDEREERVELWKELGLDARRKPPADVSPPDTSPSPSRVAPPSTSPALPSGDSGIGPDPIEERERSGGAFTVRYHSGEMDRGAWDLPLVLLLAGNRPGPVSGFEIEDENFQGWSGDFAFPLPELGTRFDLPGLRFDFGVRASSSSFYGMAPDRSLALLGANGSVLLDPLGPGGSFGNGGQGFPGNNGFGDHRGIRASGDYEEHLLRFGLLVDCIEHERFTLTSGIALLYGETEENFGISGRTGFVGGAPTSIYRYGNQMKTEQLGLELGGQLEFPLGQVGGLPLTAWLDGRVRFLAIDAGASSAAALSGQANLVSANNRLEDSWSDVGLAGSAGIAVALSESAELTFGVVAETGEVGSIGATPGSPFFIRQQDRTSVAGTVGFTVRY